MAPKSPEFDLPEAPAIKSGPELIAAVPDPARFAKKVAAMSEARALDLVSRIQTAPDAATVWALHSEFHGRGIPPSLRGPRHELGAQGDFLELAADLLWLQHQWPHHLPRYRLAQRLFTTEPATPDWHALALVFSASHSDTRGRVIALGLHPHQRLDLRALADSASRRRFDGLHGGRFGELFDALTEAAADKPDKAGKFTPADTARRRAWLWRIHELSGRNHQRTAQLWAVMSGNTITRQQVARHIAAAAPVVAELERQRRLASEPPSPIP